VHDNSRPAIATISDLNPGLAYAAGVTNPTTAKPELRRFFHSIQKLSQVLQDEEKGTLNTVAMQQKLTQVNQLNSKVSQSAQKLGNRITKNPLSQWLQASASNQGHLSDVLDRAATATNRDILPPLKHAHRSVRQFNQHLLKINAKISQPAPAPAPANP
jgi:ribosomal protein L16 Arg81 hydroxylase